MKKFFQKNKENSKTPEKKEASPAKPKKLPKVTLPRSSRKKISYPRKPRFTLLIGDEGAVLLYMKGNMVLSRQFVPDASEGNLEELRETIAKDRQAAITMVIDSVDQSFVQQTLPPVSSLSVQKLIKRRLDRDFKPADIKGAIILGKDKEGRKDWNFLMVSVDKSPQLVLWLDFVMTFENRFRGIVLLSAEASIIIKNLERSLGISPKTGTGSEWKILVSHNKVGGFRQIILKNGRLIFTRLALPVGEPTPEVIAGHIEQEMISTIEYLKRFGYSPSAGLDVYIVAGEDVCRLVDPKRLEAANYYALPPHLVAQHLGIKGATQTTDQFGDVVLASAVGSIRRNILKLTTVESRLYDTYQLWKYGQRLVGTFAALGLIIYAAYLGYGTLIIRSDLQDAEQKQRISQQALVSVKRKIEESKLDLELVGNQTDVYKQIKSSARTPIPFLTQLAQVVKSPVVLQSVSWKFGDTMVPSKAVPTLVNYNLTQGGKTPSAPPPAPEGKDMVTAVLLLQFPEGLKSPALFKKFSEDFLKQLHDVMPDYAIAYTSVPQEYLDVRSLQMTFDQKPVESNLGLKPVQVEVYIRGFMPTAVESEAKP